MNLKLIDTFAIPNAENNTYLTEQQLLGRVKELKQYNFKVYYILVAHKRYMRIKNIADEFAVIEVWGEI